MSPPNRRWTTLTRICVAILFVRFAVYPLAAVGRRAWPAAVPAIDTTLLLLQLTLLGVGTIAGLVWFHRAWARVPPESRRGYDGKPIEPNQALWNLFIPFYGIYWLFQANIALCGAVERMLQQSGAKSAKAPSTLAFVACVAQLVPYVNLLVSPFLWAALMARVDVAQAEAEALNPDARPPAPPSLLTSIAIAGGGFLLGGLVLVFVYLAIWQFLSPGAGLEAPR